MSRKLLSLSAAIAATLALPGSANAYEILGKQLEIYGKAHVSADFVDNDSDSELALASNSSRLGFRGITKVNEDLDAIYQIESKILFDEGGDSFAGRNTFVGLAGNFGQVRFGNQDTPVKTVRDNFDLFGDTVADARNVMDGANRRAKNSAIYVTPVVSGFQGQAMYATSYVDTQTPEGLENNDYSLASVALGYTLGGLNISAGYENTDGDDPADPDFVQVETNDVRLAANYTMGAFRVGALFDRYEEDNDDRDAWGLNAAYKFGDNALKVQYMSADDWSNSNDTGASQWAVGLDHKLSKNLTVYSIYSQLKNDDNTKSYRIKGGHDTDVYKVAALGDDINVFSVGMVFAF